MDKVMKAMASPIKSKPVFTPGQTIRVLKNIDVNMPKSLNYWLNSECIVLRCIPRGLMIKEWSYLLKHKNGRECEFKAGELDNRYIRKSKL